MNYFYIFISLLIFISCETNLEQIPCKETLFPEVKKLNKINGFEAFSFSNDKRYYSKAGPMSFKQWGNKRFNPTSKYYLEYEFNKDSCPEGFTLNAVYPFPSSFLKNTYAILAFFEDQQKVDLSEIRTLITQFEKKSKTEPSFKTCNTINNELAYCILYHNGVTRKVVNISFYKNSFFEKLREKNPKF